MFIGRKAQTCSSTMMKVEPKHSCPVLFQLGEEYSVRLSGNAPLTVKSRLNSMLHCQNWVTVGRSGLLLFFSEFSSNQTNLDSSYFASEVRMEMHTWTPTHTHIPIHKYLYHHMAKKQKQI